MVEKVTEILNTEARSAATYSIEVTPDIMEHELDNLNFEPKFVSITWHAQTHGCKNLEIRPLQLAKCLRRKGKNVLLHISCNYMRQNYLDDLLALLKDLGICNLFVILGEDFDPQNSDFTNSRNMITYIRRRTGKYFCIGVAGFPDRDENVLQLQEKVNSGADFILTQAFFDCISFKKFMTSCREAGINVPIIPGIFPFETEKELTGFVKLCKVHVNILMNFNNRTGIDIVGELINELIHELQIKHCHFFTLNKLQRTSDVITKAINNN